MKKLAITAILSASLAAYADVTITGDVNITEDTVVTSTVQITGAGTMTFEDPSYVYNLDFVPASGNVNLITATADYNIDGTLFVSGPSAQTATYWMFLRQKAGKTLTIADLQLATTRTVRSGFQFLGTDTSSINPITATASDFSSALSTYVVSSSQANVFAQGSSCEQWLNKTNFVAQSAISYGYVHFQFGSRFVVDTDGVVVSTAAMRQPYKVTSDRAAADADPTKSFTGYIDLNGHNLTINSLVWNPSSAKAVREECSCVDFYIDFGEGNSVAQICYIATMSEAGYVIGTWQNYYPNDRLYVKNASEGDMIVFGDWTTNQANYETVLTNISELDYEITQLTEGTYAGKYAMVFSAVPEPSTYAAIFGAVALAFAAYRRRK